MVVPLIACLTEAMRCQAEKVRTFGGARTKGRAGIAAHQRDVMPGPAEQVGRGDADDTGSHDSDTGHDSIPLP